MASRQLTILPLVAVLLLLSTSARAQNPAPDGSLFIRYSKGLYGQQSDPTNAISTIIGPFAPGTELGLFVFATNPSGKTQHISQIRVLWAGRPTDFVPTGTAFDYNGVATQATVLNNQAIWGFDPFQPNSTHVVLAGTYGLDLFATAGTIGNVDAEFLPITIEMTDDVFGTQTATYLVQIAPASPPPPRPSTPAPTVAHTAPPTPVPTSPKVTTPAPTVSTTAVNSPTATPAPTNHKKHHGRRLMA